jgi:hypothetical protein
MPMMNWPLAVRAFGHRDRCFDAKLIAGAGFPVADTFDLGRMKCTELVLVVTLPQADRDAVRTYDVLRWTDNPALRPGKATSDKDERSTRQANAGLHHIGAD